MKTLTKRKVQEALNILWEMYPDAACALNYDSKFHLLVSVVLSAQTTDVSVNKVTPVLWEHYPKPADLASAEQSDVEDIIRAIGLYKNKSKNIIALARMITDEYGGEVPGEFDELVKLPGVGRKTANVVLAEAFGQDRIAVDTHVFRVANRIGLVSEKDVNATEEALMKIIPKDGKHAAHHLLIFHGRRCCTARKPACERCGLKDLCLSIDKVR